ncbi:MAG: UDP-N-acetylmuramate--L-alanine ligase [Candidatus Omnitrophota bacterium]|jgi:UDP-N-acetylmuramate--alanine ligase
MILDKKNIHFVGVGGIGMSGIAFILAGMGYKVSGSDLKMNALTSKIENSGGRIYKGHNSSNVGPETEAVVFSSAISGDNPEIVEAKRRNIPIVQRAEVLGELLNAKKGIAVSGTHGKTTTTSLISVMLENSGLDPTVIIGGEMEAFNGNAKAGSGQYLVAEADESDGSFLHLKPLYSVITNIEMEHMDYYKSLDDVLKSYSAFANNIKESGSVFYNYADANASKVLKGFKGVTESFGYSPDADIHAVDVKMEAFDTSYTCVYKNKTLGKVGLKIPGMHNVLNSLAAILVGLRMGIAFDTITNSIKDFKGTKRRFHLRSDSGDVILIDDYAHHPTEIKAVLSACRNWKGRRVIVIFQPHRYSRTMHLADEFGKSFDGADKLILTEIYAASEKPIEGISVKSIYDKVKLNGHIDAVMMDKGKITDHVMKIKRPGDMILVLGAGNITEIADELSKKLSDK